MNRKELISETLRLSSDEFESNQDYLDLAIKTNKELSSSLSLIKENIRNGIFEQLSDSLSDVIGSASSLMVDEETKKLEQLQEELTTLIAAIKIKRF